MDKKDLARSLAATAYAIVAQWGNPIGTESGSITVSVGRYGDRCLIQPKLLNWPGDGVTLNCYEGNWSSKNSIHEMLRTVEVLQALALYLASDDFVSKVRGSISRLKKIQRALS